MWRGPSFKKTRWHLFLLSIAAPLIFSLGLNAQTGRIRIAVVGLDNPSTFGKSNIGNSLVDQLDTQISTVGKYTLLERAELGELQKELSLGQSSLANAKSFAQIGGLKGADFLLTGKVSDYTYSETISRKMEDVPGVGMEAVAYYDHIAHVRIDLRVMAVKTGVDVRSISGEGTSDSSSRYSYESEWNSYVASEGQGTLTNLRSLLTSASHEAIQNAVSQLNDMEPDLETYLANQSVKSEVSSIGDGTILAAIGPGQFVIGVPSTANLMVGDRFHVVAEVPIKNVQGIVVYREKKNVGTLQIANISESTKALASIVSTPGASAGAPGPEQGDTLVFERAYGKSLRGMAVPPAAGATSSAGPAAGADARQVATYLRRGDRFMDQNNYAEALDQYKQALQLQPGNPEALEKEVSADLEVGDLSDAEDNADKAIAAGGSISIPVYHRLFINCSLGVLKVGKGNVAFQPDRGNGAFSVDAAAQLSTSESQPFEVGPGGAVLPWLSIRWRNSNGKWKKYDMVPTALLTSAGFCEYSASGDAAAKTARLEGMLLRLIKLALP